MIGQVIGPRSNVIILAGGQGSRMGAGSEYLPKALVSLGSRRAIDWIIHRHQIVAEKFIIGTGRHHDLLEAYVKGSYSGLDVEFSREDAPKNNAISTMLALDHADSRIPTIITFCDLLIFSPQTVKDVACFAVATGGGTKGTMGTFRHLFEEDTGIDQAAPKELAYGQHGVLGWFYFPDTRQLKRMVYDLADKDFTDDILIPWKVFGESPLEPYYASGVYDFGTEADLVEVRRQWEEL